MGLIWCVASDDCRCFREGLLAQLERGVDCGDSVGFKTVSGHNGQTLLIIPRLPRYHRCRRIFSVQFFVQVCIIGNITKLRFTLVVFVRFCS
jgi:hypothetical protein